MRPTFSDLSVAAEAFAAGNLVERAMHAHEKDVEGSQERRSGSPSET